MNQIIQQLKNSRNVLLASHENPDGDAIGSLLALGLALDLLKKKTTLYNPSPIPAVYRFLPSVKRVVKHLRKGDNFDTAVILDCGDFKRIGHGAATAAQVPVTINVDHHVTNTGFGTYQLIDTQACATAEIVYRLIKALDVAFSRDMAKSIYTGILTDTGSFRFSNTNHSAFAICEEMIACGADPYGIAQHVYGKYSLGRIKLLNLALDSIEISRNGRLSLMTVTKEMLSETGTQPEDADGLINYARRIEAVTVAALVQEQTNNKGSIKKNQFHVSLRSDGTVDVARIAAAFGGGGHASASGFSIQAPLADIKDRIMGLAEEL
ncbi:MAG: DHH family phosphoesterase [Desulfobacterales bacterium]|nr:DHH family phosphoesterase [Desulfobacterales bacterium]